MGHFAARWLTCFLITSCLSRIKCVDSDSDNTTTTQSWTTTSTFTKNTLALATTPSPISTTVTDENSTTTTISVTVTTTTGGLAIQLASAVNAILLTDIVLHTATILAGVTMVAIGHKVPILLAGSLVLAIFVGMLTKTGQESNPEASQWIFWPSISAVCCLMFMCVLIKYFRDVMVSVITGTLLATLGVTITVSAALPVWSLKSFPKEVPWGVAVGAVLYVVGHEAARQMAERPFFYKMLSAFIGGWLIADGSLFYLHGRDFAKEVSNAMVRATTNSKEDRSDIASEVRIQVAGWVAISMGLFFMRFAVRGMWHKYKPQRFREKDEQSASCESLDTGDLEKGEAKGDRQSSESKGVPGRGELEAASLRSELRNEEEKSDDDDDRVWAF